MSIPTELLPLVNHKLKSGFTGVYAHRGKWRWCEPFVKRHHGMYDTPREAAAQLAAWWKGHFGDGWVAYFKARSAVPWIAKPTASGWSLFVYVRGERWAVPPPPAPLRDRGEAKRYLVDHCRRTFGPDAWLFVRRVAGGATP